MKPAFIALPFAAAACVIGAIVIALWMIGSASGERDRFSSLDIAPHDADVFVAINTDPTSPQWLAVNNSLETLNLKDPIRRLIDESLAEVGLEWERDITPIAGDEAFFSVASLGDAVDSTGFTAGFQVRNMKKAQEVFESLRERAAEDGFEFEEEEYEGVTIFYSEPPEFDWDGWSSGGSVEFQVPIVPPYDEGEYEPSCLSFSFFREPGEELPEKCLEFADCPWFNDDPFDDSDGEDANNDGTPDACEGLFEDGDWFSGDDWFEDEWTFGNDEDGSNRVTIDFASGPEFVAPESGAVALFSGVLAVGGTPEDVKAVIDVVQGRSPSAASNGRLTEFRDLQRDDFLMWAYVDLAAVWELAEAFTQEGATPFDAGTLFEQLRGEFDRAGFSISSMRDGFALDFTVLQAPEYQAAYTWEPSEPFTPQFADAVGDDTLFFFAVNRFFRQAYAQFSEQLHELDQDQREAFDDLLEEVQRETGVHLETDVFSLLTGEIAVALNASGFGDGAEAEVVGFAEVSDGGKAASTLTRLGEYLASILFIETAVNGEVNEWRAFGEPAGDAFGWAIDGNVVVAGYPSTMVEKARGRPAAPLTESRDWQRTLDLLPRNGAFVGFLSIARVLEEVRAQSGGGSPVGESIDGDFDLDDLEPLRSVGFAGTIRENGFGFHMVLFMEDR